MFSKIFAELPWVNFYGFVENLSGKAIACQQSHVFQVYLYIFFNSIITNYTQ